MEWLAIYQLVYNLFVPSLFLIISCFVYYIDRYYRPERSLVEAQVPASQPETPSQLDIETPPPSYEEATKYPFGLRHRNSKDPNFTSNEINFKSRDSTVQFNSEEATDGKYNGGDGSNNLNDDKVAIEGDSDDKFSFEDDSIYAIMLLPESHNFTLDNFIENCDKYEDDSGKNLNNVDDDENGKEYDIGKKSNTRKNSCKKCKCKDDVSSIGSSEGDSGGQYSSEDDIIIHENGSQQSRVYIQVGITEKITIGKCNNEIDSDDKGEDASGKMLDTVEDDMCGKENNIVGESNSGDDISITSKYDTASGGSGVTI